MKEKHPCTYEPCPRPRTSTGLCHGHNRQAKAGKQLAPLMLRGFALMVDADPESFKQMSSSAGKEAHRKGLAHEFKKGHEAKSIGQRGGEASAIVRRRQPPAV